MTVDNLEEDVSLIALPAGRAEGISSQMMSDTALIRVVALEISAEIKRVNSRAREGYQDDI